MSLEIEEKFIINNYPDLMHIRYTPKVKDSMLYDSDRVRPFN